MKTMKMLALVVMMATCGKVAQAQNHQDDAYPVHREIVKTNSSYHIEILKRDGKDVFCLLDAEKKKLPNRGITGNVTIKYADKTSANAALKATGDDGLYAETDKKTEVISWTVTLMVNGKELTATFVHHHH